MPSQHSVPRMHASVHWPETNFANVRLAILATKNRLSAHLRGRNATHTRAVWLFSFSLPSRIYSAKMNAMMALNTPPTMPDSTDTVPPSRLPAPSVT